MGHFFVIRVTSWLLLIRFAITIVWFLLMVMLNLVTIVDNLYQLGFALRYRFVRLNCRFSFLCREVMVRVGLIGGAECLHARFRLYRQLCNPNDDGRVTSVAFHCNFHYRVSHAFSLQSTGRPMATYRSRCNCHYDGSRFLLFRGVVYVTL